MGLQRNLWIGVNVAMLMMMRATCEAQHGTGLVLVDQDGAHVQPVLRSMPLTVRPSKLTLGQQNPAAGVHALRSADSALAYVPAACVGARRCPLVVFLHPSATNARYVVNQWHAVSDKYGMILLAPNSPHYWQLISEADDRQHLDSAMTQVLEEFAIDTTRIAIIGYSASGGGTMGLGGYRLDLFSRVILGSTDFSIATVDPHNRTTQFLLVDAFKGSRAIFDQGKALRHAGHPVKQMIGFREHQSQPEDWDFMGRWLQESWAVPNPARRPRSRVVATKVVRITPAMMNLMIRFWTRFSKEPDSVLKTARLQHLKETVIPIHGQHVTMLMTDMPALAAASASVAADLKEAGLTAQEHDTIRIALASANISRFVLRGPKAAGPHVVQKIPGLPFVLADLLDSLDVVDSRGKPPYTLSKTSTEQKNVDFLETYPTRFKELKEAGMWVTP